MSIGESTLLYLFVFLLSCFFTYCAEKKFKLHSDRKAVVLSLIAVLIPSILAGVRDDTVGKDVLQYAVRTFNYAEMSTSFTQMQELSKEPVGYVILAYITSRLFNDTGYFLFASQLMVIGPVYYALYKNRKRFPMWLGMCTYLFVFYNNSFNIMKQSVSAAFIVLCYCFIKEKKLIKAAICFVIAISFHFSAVFGLLFILLSSFVKNKTDTTSKIIMATVFFLIIMNLEGLSTFLIENSFLPEKYTRNIYAVFDLDADVYLRIVGFNAHVFMDWIFRVLLVVLPILGFGRVNRKVDENVKILTVIGLIFYTYVLFAFRTVYGGRISMYCDFFLILLVPRVQKVFTRRSFAERTAANAVIVSFMGIYWYLWVMVSGWSASNYFKFRF